MRQVVVTHTKLRAILIVSALGVLITACSGGKPFDYQEIGEIGKGPGLLTGASGEAAFDPKTGEFKLGNRDAIARQNSRTAEVRRRRARARRRQEGATGG